jgi:hypothetical protein
MRNAEIPKQAHQQRLHFGVSQTGKSKIKGTLTFEVANPEIPKQAHQQRLHFGVSQTGKSKIKGTLTFEVANPEILKQAHQQTTSAKDTWHNQAMTSVKLIQHFRHM